jgi:probable F420-dependent oxidoreductase
MDIGITCFPVDHGLPVPELARMAEDIGFESLFLSEHTHQPLAHEAETGRAPSDDFSRTLDPFVALAAAATTTSTLRLGTAVCLVTERDPIILAKEVASLDLLSNGRVVLGVGAGWNTSELRNHGTDPKRRWAVLRERVEAARVIWSSEVAEYHGEFVDFGPLESWPKPVQQPSPPVLVGGTGAHARHRVVRFGDGWIPYGMPVEVLAPQIEDLRAAAADAGRLEPSVSVFAAPADRAALDALELLGVERALLLLPNRDPDAARKLLEKYAPLLGG